jgi:hypothetical protein
MNEVVRSFNILRYRQKSFATKADINKAYVDWQFIEQTMQVVGFPPSLIQIIMS